MEEFQANVLPAGTVPNYTGTWVWGYRHAAPVSPEETYIGPVFLKARNERLQIKWINNLPLNRAASSLPFWWTATDQTLHWADPLNNEANNCNMSIVPGVAPFPPCNQNYDGPVPAVVHLHGGEVPPVLDGGPDAWVTSDGNYSGHGYYSRDVTNQGDPANGNYAIYRYPNSQEAANIWFHDHVLGATRLNVHAVLAGAYIITDNAHTNAALQDPTQIIPLVIQDRMFDANGQFFFPNIGLNPEHPFWVPEFVGDVIVVNGKSWPFLDVQAGQKYRFLFLNGSNARAYQLQFKVQGKGTAPLMWVIGTDGGYLDHPVQIAQLTIMPGERYDVIVDFTNVAAGTTLLLTNSARTPFPGGAPVQSSTTGRIIKINVLTAATTPTTLFTPTTGANLRPGAPIQRPAITEPPVGTHTPIRRLTLNEVLGPGGPLEVLVNNTKWSGDSPRNALYGDFLPITTPSVGGITTYYSELPKEGAVEVWEVINLTADAHPIHLHLVQFQLLSRQPFNMKAYLPVYDGAFPGGLYIPAFGPPQSYAPLNDPTLCSDSGVTCGGNPDVTPYLLGARLGPAPYENGWKDTVIMYPGEVTRIMVRWAPTDTPAASTTGTFIFSPDGGHGYVWHCHIIDHEDNEMMRPDSVQAAAVGRTYVQGVNY